LAGVEQLIASLKRQQQRLIRLYAEEGDDTSPDAFRAERDRMRQEIAAAETSLTETEGRLEINESDLCRALELAENIAGIYELADDRTKRGYNQAFFTRIKIRARWDDNAGRTAVEVAGVELTAPYAVLLADETEREALAWVDAVKAGERPQKAEKHPQGPSERASEALSGDDISIYEVLAEREGFEPSNEVSPVTRFPVAPIQPLWHLSWHSATIFAAPAAR
jgi:hypothetical protein